MNGKEATMVNLDSFLEVFGENINKTLARLVSEERRGSPSVAASKRHARTRLCFVLLGAPNARFHVATGYCDGLQMTSYLQGGPNSEVITRDTFRKDVGERACMFRDFFRTNRIYETWGIRL